MPAPVAPRRVLALLAMSWLCACAGPSTAGSSSRTRTDDLATTPPAGSVGPANDHEDADDRDETTSDTAADTRTPAADDPAVRAIRSLADRIVAALALARGLPADGTFAVKLVDKVAVRKFVETSLYEHQTPEKVELLGRVSSSLGVLPSNAHGPTVLLDLYEAGVLGYYDPKSKTFSVGSFVPGVMLEMVVGHELAHAVQDMHFDLARHQLPLQRGPSSGESDREAARTFLIEGDAQATFLAWKSGPRGAEGISDTVLEAMADDTLGIDGSMVPYPVLARMMQMPYTDGTRTVLAIVRSKGWAGIDALFSDMPTTTEQMLHLDKLESREPALPVTIDATSLVPTWPGAKLVYDDDLGEAALLAMLSEVESPRAARAAAAGWGGDRFVAIDLPGAPLLVVVGAIAWDSVADAKEFEGPFRRYLEGVRAQDHFVERRGSVVIFATGRAPSRELSQAAWSAVSVPPVQKPKARSTNTKARTKDAAG